MPYIGTPYRVVGDVNRHGLAVGLDQVTVRLMTTNVALTPNIPNIHQIFMTPNIQIFHRYALPR